MGKLYVVGIGPGGLNDMTLKAKKAIEESEIIVGYTKYISMIEELILGKEVFQTGMKQEVDRCKKALELSQNKVVSIISTGDAGIYGMAGLILEMKKDEIVEVIPGVTSSIAAAACLGSPLMHDNCLISLSDLMTPYDLIKKRVLLAAEGDFVISFYNPRSKGRPNYLRECIDIIREYREDTTPVGIVKNAMRQGEEVSITTLQNFDETKVDMMSMVIIGNSNTFIKGNMMITPRGYKL
ncbi:precorrin-3B C(17)-methyltransferase [Clostridium felsineum]|uniref:precorrin-3B C(17)-methyltransferase n=1 Tax=Clostridium felsineum TaxID=36839 RepID=UPI00098CCAD9|nr:precorrin-3B C(17)-methyltransferase [Clostridium felsineum]URZ15899.1 putative cobalt-factor III C(17)-methyltransferase [Clostridium felsineum DSM 794]